MCTSGLSDRFPYHVVVVCILQRFPWDHELARPNFGPAKRVPEVFVHRWHQRPLGIRVHKALQTAGGQLESLVLQEGEKYCQGRREKGDYVLSA